MTENQAETMIIHLAAIAENTSYQPTLRDQLAMAAPANELDIGTNGATQDAICKARYRWADAMLKARKEWT